MGGMNRKRQFLCTLVLLLLDYVGDIQLDRPGQCLHYLLGLEWAWGRYAIVYR